MYETLSLLHEQLISYRTSFWLCFRGQKHFLPAKAAIMPRTHEAHKLLVFAQISNLSQFAQTCGGFFCSCVPGLT